MSRLIMCVRWCGGFWGRRHEFEKRQITFRASMTDGQPLVEVELPDAAVERVRLGALANQHLALDRSETQMRDAEALCEGCSVMGTVGIAVRFDAENAPIEIHRFCALCWPEQSARYIARWDEEVRVASEASLRGELLDATNTSSMFGSTTWHGTLALVREIERSMHPPLPPTPQDLARMAAEIARVAPTHDGAMPHEVMMFIQRHHDSRHV